MVLSVWMKMKPAWGATSTIFSMNEDAEVGVQVARMMMYCCPGCGGYTRLSGIWGEMRMLLRPRQGLHAWRQSPGPDLGRSNWVGALRLCLWEQGHCVRLCSLLLHKDIQPRLGCNPGHSRFPKPPAEDAFY